MKYLAIGLGALAFAAAPAMAQTTPQTSPEAAAAASQASGSSGSETWATGPKTTQSRDSGGGGLAGASFGTLDRNNDDRLSPEEAEEAGSRLEQADTDDDGYVTREEFSASR